MAADDVSGRYNSAFDLPIATTQTNSVKALTGVRY